MSRAGALLLPALVACADEGGALDAAADAALDRVPDAAVEGSSSKADAASSPDAAAAFGALFGRDALGRAYEASQTLPADYEALEAWLRIGRRCDDPESKRIYLVEEKQTRPDGFVVATDEVVPRIVIAGCSGGPLSRAEVMGALVSRPGTDPLDPLERTRVELIALDEGTGLYNFYEIFFGATARVVRIHGRDREQVEQTSWDALGGFTTTTLNERRCFACHVNGGPLMNELSSPWLGWVSEARSHALRTYQGLSGALAREAEPSGETGGSLAYDLERGLRAGLERYVSGTGNEARGFARSVADGTLPGGAQRLLRSVFCETELNHQPPSLAVFLDPQATDGADISFSSLPTTADWPRLIPVRSHFDRVVEQWLVGQGYLRPETVLAIRLVDVQRDIFSERRCALLAQLPTSLPDQPRELDEKVCTLLAEFWRGQGSDDATRAYAEALCASADSAALRDAYRSFVVNDAASLARDGGSGELAQRAWERVQRARALHPGAASPLPRSLP